MSSVLSYPIYYYLLFVYIVNYKTTVQGLVKWLLTKMSLLGVWFVFCLVLRLLVFSRWWTKLALLWWHRSVLQYRQDLILKILNLTVFTQGPFSINKTWQSNWDITSTIFRGGSRADHGFVRLMEVLQVANVHWLQRTTEKVKYISSDYGLQVNVMISCNDVY